MIEFRNETVVKLSKMIVEYTLNDKQGLAIAFVEQCELDEMGIFNLGSVRILYNIFDFDIAIGTKINDRGEKVTLSSTEIEEYLNIDITTTDED